jgi:hypothetical protein
MGEYQAPFEIHHPLMDLSIQAVPIRAGIGVTAINGGTFRLDLAVGSGVDLFVTTPRTRLPEARLAQQRPFGSPIVTGRIALHLAVARSADVWLAFSLDADLTPRRWVFAAGPNNEPQPVYVPWQFRPALQLGFSFAALGPGPILDAWGRHRERSRAHAGRCPVRLRPSRHRRAAFAAVGRWRHAGLRA